MARHHIDELLINLARQLEMDDLRLDDGNHCILKIEDGPDLHLEYFDDEDLVVLAAALEPVAEALRPAAYRMLLKANFMWQGTAGATLALNPDSDAVIVQHKLVAANIGSESFMGVIDGFDGLCRLCREELDGLSLNSPDDEPHSTDAVAIRV